VASWWRRLWGAGDRGDDREAREDDGLWRGEVLRRLDELKELGAHDAAMAQDALQRLERVERLLTDGDARAPQGGP
jgi:hypothetical protein